MKKNPFLAWLLIFVVFLFACQVETEETFTGTIQTINGESALVTIETGDILNSGDQVMVDLTKAPDTTFKVGDHIRVGHEGPIQESYPLGIQTTSVEKIE